jgi:uncharacterized protein
MIRIVLVILFVNTALSAPIRENRAPLKQNHFYTLPLGSIKPKGWLYKQLKLQAEGLTGHLDEFWPSVGKDSGWLGGNGESWERGPYYLDGLLPLAHLLEDRALIIKAERWIEWTLRNQRADGSIGPVKNRDWWPVMVMMKVLIQHYEATKDSRVIPLMSRYFDYQYRNIRSRPLHEWARYRWPENLVSILWLYNHTGERKLIELARILKGQGYDWRSEYENFLFKSRTSREALGLKSDMSNTTDLSMRAHGVNVAMALKAMPLSYLLIGSESVRRAFYTQLSTLDQYHKLPNGMFSGDEHLAGSDPTQGIETCAIVEAIYSFNHIISILGDPLMGDRLERIAFNALPAAFSSDMWAHQYNQQPNQVVCDIQPRNWTTNGDDSNVFGLEPWFGCCTANMHQGWPKFVSTLWMATQTGGLVATTYAPAEINTVLSGVPVSIKVDTLYPFDEDISIRIEPARPVSFPLKLRIPEWANGAQLRVGQRSVKAYPGTFAEIKRIWKAGDRVTLRFPANLRTSAWTNNSRVIEYGPLVMSLRVGEQWRRITEGMPKPAIPPAADWAVYPENPWNYALVLDDKEAHKYFVVVKRDGENLFSDSGTPLIIEARGRRVDSWKIEKGSAGPLPQSPVSVKSREEKITLIPYGSAKLRVTALPWTRP